MSLGRKLGNERTRMSGEGGCKVEPKGPLMTPLDKAIKPCPFCGSPGAVDHGGPHEPDEWCCFCSGCDFSLGFQLTRDEAVAAWNRRADLSSVKLEEGDLVWLRATINARRLDIRTSNSGIASMQNARINRLIAFLGQGGA